MQTFAINTDNDVPLKTKHIAYYIQENSENICLFEIVENTYKHPQAPEDLTIQVFESCRVGNAKKGTTKAAGLILFQNAELNLEIVKEFLN